MAGSQLNSRQHAHGAASESEFSPLIRPEILSRLDSKTFDIAIIGGGITGAGVARDAASRGMSVALVEARDFAEGTSSRSSKLIHGGIRYLENLEFGLVFEALSERRLLFEIAPHLVHPLRFVLPLYKGGRVGMFKMGLGMWLYDALSLFEAPELHERLTSHETLERLPLLRDRDLLGSYVYSDAYMDDDRLVHETLRSAVGLGATCVSHVSADSAELVDGTVRSIGCTDRITGKRLRVRARHFISTVGPWTDLVAPKLLGDWHKVLRPSKGVHLTFRRERLQLNQAVVMAAEKRIVFGIPRNEMTIIGTTDTDYSGDPGDVSTDIEDVKYILGVAEKYFPGAKLKVEDVIASYAGVRPLVDDGAATESKTSREHVILKDPRNVTFVAGGKYTTYRLMAEQAVKAVLDDFAIEDQVRFGRNDTKRPLNPLATITKMNDSLRHVRSWAREYAMDHKLVELLVQRHGAEALTILKKYGKLSPASDVGKHLSKGEADEVRLWEMEARHAIHTTMCMGLIDFYFRRTRLFLARKDHGLPLIDTMAAVFAQELGWSDAVMKEQTAALRAAIQHDLQWQRGPWPGAMS